LRVCVTDTVNINVGGPVWSMAWCPVNSDHPSRQYLAVYTHRHAADRHVFDETSRDVAVIQLYDCGLLSSRHADRYIKKS